MRGKAVIPDMKLDQLKRGLENPLTVARLLDALECLPRVKGMGPAERFVEKPGFSIPIPTDELGVTFTWSGISVEGRSRTDFYNVLTATADVICSVVRENVPRGIRIQVVVIVEVDRLTSDITDITGKMTTLLESTPIWIEGELAPFD